MSFSFSEDKSVTIDRCPICASFNGQRVQPRESLVYYCCKSCSHCTQVFEAGASSAAFETAQGKYYGPTFQAFSGELSLFEREVIAARASLLDSVIRTPGNVLEVGPGGGHVVAWLLSRGHRVTAVEHSSALAIELAKHVRAEIKIGEFESMHLEDGPFDLFCSFHVIEHVKDPVAHLSKAFMLVRPGGFAIVATPNSRSWEQIFFPLLSPNFDLAHLHVFSPDSLRTACEKSGWKVVRISTPEFSPGWLRVLTKCLRRLRNENEEDTAGKYSQTTSVAMMILAKTIQIVTSPFRFFQRILGYGNEVLVLLQKP